MRTLCRKLIPVIAANWLIWEETKGKQSFLGPGFPTEKRDLLIQQLLQKVELSATTLETKLAEKEHEIESLLERLETAYGKINGKYLLNSLYRQFRVPASESHFRRLQGASL